ncbi:hypothetical protein KC717_03570 [Candidatus Dojkabacteria bacterium]|uniref:Uncharacterized protein n=1 Tax=Candidatus Dojkabacteria bacterium TaxID=2099670 RepID=A0A955L903_9BACT|nr:hypothetical protein [Candidatus Dojkabacteria bacterium]
MIDPLDLVTTLDIFLFFLTLGLLWYFVSSIVRLPMIDLFKPSETNSTIVNLITYLHNENLIELPQSLKIERQNNDILTYLDNDGIVVDSTYATAPILHNLFEFLFVVMTRNSKWVQQIRPIYTILALLWSMVILLCLLVVLTQTGLWLISGIRYSLLCISISLMIDLLIRTRLIDELLHYIYSIPLFSDREKDMIQNELERWRFGLFFIFLEPFLSLKKLLLR